MNDVTPIVRESATPFAIPARVFAESVTAMEHFSNRLFRFCITRPASLWLFPGQFVMIGLPHADKPVNYAYLIVRPS